MLCWEPAVSFWVSASPVEQPPESGYRLCQCLASSETKMVSWKDWGPSVVCPSRLSLSCCCICYPHPHSCTLPLCVWKIPAKLSRYCDSLSPPQWGISSHVLLLQLDIFPLKMKWLKLQNCNHHYKQSRAGAIISFYAHAEYGQTCWSSKWFHMVMPSNKTALYFL